MRGVDVEAARTWWRKWRWYERDALPWRRLAIHRELARRGTFARWPIQGEVLEIDEPRLLRCRWTGGFGDTEVTYELTPEAGGTRLRVRHDGWTDATADRGGFDDGWKQKLDQDLPRVLGPAH